MFAAGTTREDGSAMAWITKDSAGTRVERRAEPYLTEGMRRTLDETYKPRYETTMACILPALHLIQHEYGWVPKQAMDEIAAHLEVKPSDVFDTATFYEEYWLKPKGKTLVQVCRSIACEFCGQPELTQSIKDKLDIEVGETTEDGKFTLIELECLGSCGTAPAALVNETLHENVTIEQMSEILDRVSRDIDEGKAGH
ncbi:MAG: NADH-quinone oxidoreductase subunit NuoE [Planctomycetota bacterium]